MFRFLKNMDHRPVATLLVLLAVGLPLTASQPNFESNQTVDDFTLIDHTGKAHRLHYFGDDQSTKAIVLFIQGNGCPLVQKQVPDLTKLQTEFPSAVFWMLNANSQDTREEIASEAKEFNVTLPILIDETQLIARALKVSRTAESIVINPRNWKIVYRGPISDRLSYQTEKPKASKNYLRDTLTALKSDKKTPHPLVVSSPGCRVKLLDSDPVQHAKISYSKTIAPLLISKCADCHSEGGLGPFAMSSYRKVRGWSDMMKEVVLTRIMPPWQADAHFGDFSNDFSLSPEEQKTLINWIDAGSPRGEGPDPLTEFKPHRPEWHLGKPDAIIDIPEQSIKAEGVEPYRYLTLDSIFDEDVWVKAFEVRPGNTRVLHHIIATVLEERPGQKPRRKGLAGYAPGAEPEPFPEGTGVRIKKGSKVRLQLHYTTSGKPEKDHSQIGLYFSKGPVEKELHGGLVIDTKFKIPPHAREHTVRKSKLINRDVYLHSVFPHMHYRGKAMSYEAKYPDGTKEILLSVPNYHFNWQRHYKFTEPKMLPKGTRLEVTATWDNSELNAYNPDPTKVVGWGEQSWEEMFFATYKFTDK